MNPPPRHGVFPAGTESSSILSKVQRRPGVERGRRAEEGLHQRDAPGPGGVPACHGEADVHPGWPIWRVQPGIRRSGLKTETPIDSRPGSWKPTEGVRTAAGCFQMPSRASCVQKRAFPVLFPGVSWGCCKHARLKKDFWSTFKSPNEAATRGGYNYYNTDKSNNVHGEIWFIFCHSSLCTLQLKVHIRVVASGKNLNRINWWEYEEIFIQGCLLALTKQGDNGH